MVFQKISFFQPLYGVLSKTWKRDAELRPDIAQIKIDTDNILSKGDFFMTFSYDLLSSTVFTV